MKVKSDPWSYKGSYSRGMHTSEVDPFILVCRQNPERKRNLNLLHQKYMYILW